MLLWDSSPSSAPPRQRKEISTTPLKKSSPLTSRATTRASPLVFATISSKATTSSNATSKSTLKKSTRYTPRPKDTVEHERQLQSHATQLRAAASEGMDTQVRHILEQARWKKLHVIDKTDQWGYTALIEASMWGHHLTVLALLELNANVEAKSVAGETALHWAAMNGHSKVVDRLLIDGSANPNIKTNGKNRAGKNRTPLHLAAEKGHAAVVKALVHAGCDVLACDKYGQTAFDLAVTSQHTDIVAILQSCDTKRVQRDTIIHLQR